MQKLINIEQLKKFRLTKVGLIVAAFILILLVASLRSKILVSKIDYFLKNLKFYFLGFKDISNVNYLNRIS